MIIRTCLHGGGGPQIGEVTCGGSPDLSCKRDQINVRDCMDRRVTPGPNTQNCMKIIAYITYSNLLFIALITHKPSTVSSSLLCYKIASKDCWKNEKDNRFPDDISNPPCCVVTLLFRAFPKLEKPGLATGHLLSF